MSDSDDRLKIGPVSPAAQKQVQRLPPFSLKDEPEDSPLRKLKEKHLVYVDEYCTGRRTGVRFNKTHAAIAAGFKSSSATQTANTLHNRAHIREAVEYRMRQTHMSPAEVISRLQAIAEAPIGEFIVMSASGSFILNKEAWPKVQPFVSEFGYDSNGLPKFKFHNSHDALKDLARVYGLNKDAGPLGEGGAVNVNLTINFVETKPGAVPVPTEVVEEGEWEEI